LIWFPAKSTAIFDIFHLFFIRYLVNLFLNLAGFVFIEYIRILNAFLLRRFTRVFVDLFFLFFVLMFLVRLVLFLRVLFAGLFFRIRILFEICCFLFLFWIGSWILCSHICRIFCIAFRLGLTDDVLISCIVCIRFDHILYKMLFVREHRRLVRINCNFSALFFVFLLWWMVDVEVRLRQRKHLRIHRHLKGYLQNDLLRKNCFKNLRHLIIINLV